MKRGKLFSDIDKLVRLLGDVVGRSRQGRQTVLRLGGEKILASFRANFEASLTRDAATILSVTLGSILERDRSIVDVSMLSVKSDASAPSEVSSASSSECFTPADRVVNRSLPPFVLKSHLKQDSTFERIYSPVTRTYFNKKVTFSDNIRCRSSGLLRIRITINSIVVCRRFGHSFTIWLLK